LFGPEIYRDYPPTTLFSSVLLKGYFWLSTERLSRSTFHLKEGEREVCRYSFTL
jgi:hypothetical protein